MLSKDIDEELKAAEDAYKNHDYAQALRHYNSVLDTITRQQSSFRVEKMRAEILLKIVDVMGSSGNWVDALMYVETIINIARRNMDRQLELEANLRAAKILIDRSMWKEAEKRYHDTLELGKRHGLDTIIVQCHYGLAYTAWRLGEMDTARMGAEKTLKLAETCDEKNLRGQALILLATIADNVGDQQLAIKKFGEAIEVCKAAEDFKELGRSYNNLGEVYKGLGDYQKAREQYEMCVEASKISRDRHTAAYGLTNAAECLVRLDIIGEAKERVKEAEEILMTLDDKYANAYTRYVRALIHHKTNNQNGAVKEFETTLKNLESLKTPYDVALVSLDYGRALEDFGHRDRAKEFYTKAIEGFRKLNSVEYLEKAENALKELEAAE